MKLTLNKYVKCEKKLNYFYNHFFLYNTGESFKILHHITERWSWRGAAVV